MDTKQTQPTWVRNRMLLNRRSWLALSVITGVLNSLFTYAWFQPAAAANQSTIFGVNENREVVQINLLSGQVTPVGMLSFGTQAADQDPQTGYIYYFDRTYEADRFADWDPATNTNTLVVTYPEPPGIYPKRAAFDVNGVLYMMDNDDYLYTVRTGNGELTALGLVANLRRGPLGGTGDIAFSPDNTLYVATYRNLYTVDVTTNIATLKFANMLSSSGSTVWTGLAYCDSFLYGSTASQNPDLAGIYRIDPVSGAVTKIASLGDLLLNDLTSCSLSEPIPTSTPTETTRTVTPSSTPMETATSTPTNTPTLTPTNASTPTSTNTLTATIVPTPKKTRVPTATPALIPPGSASQ
jgi:hypothetical protein